jgi:hypothetical protein
MTWLRSARMSPKNKFRAKRIEHVGRSFASKLEAAVFDILRLREMAGEIEILQCQAQVLLTDAEIRCIPDFKCKHRASGEIFYVEAKGFESERWPIIKKLWKVYGPAPLTVYKGTYKNPQINETILPKGAS